MKVRSQYVSNWQRGVSKPNQQCVEALKQIEKEYGPIYTMTKEEIRAERARRGLTQQEMAKQLGVSSVTFGEREHGKSSPRSDHVDKMLGIKRKSFAVKKRPKKLVQDEMAKWLTNILHQTGLRRKELVALIGVHPTAFDKWRRGVSYPSEENIKKLKAIEENYGPASITTHEELKSRRKSLGLTQKEMAERMGITRVLYSKWESGTCRWDPILIDRVLGIYRKPFGVTKEERISLQNELMELTDSELNKNWMKDPFHVAKVQSISRALGIYAGK